ncbi:MAG: aldo/keto reductase [Gammaproteobacteria bacterium]|jgi:diketogulonate reductase-like aldo/keto reductase|nr:aldo/keto reductase [Gammaproteobacteria bacterium]
MSHPTLTRRKLIALGAAAGGSLLLPAMLPAAATVLRRAIPSSGEPLPVVGLGTSGVFDVEATPENLAARREIVTAMVEHGASVIDTSPMYGRAEAVVGRVVEDLGVREQIFYATKVWTRGRDQGLAQMEESFRLLRTDTIDLMQVHNLVDTQTQLASIRELQDAGRVRYSGITHYRVSEHDDLADVIEAERPDFVQVNYSITTRAAEDRLLPLAADRGVAVIVNRAFEDGSLFRAVRGREVPKWAVEAGMESWGQFFLKYVLAHPAVTCVIPGTSKPRHMRDNLGAGTGPMPDAALRRRMVAYVESL